MLKTLARVRDRSIELVFGAALVAYSGTVIFTRWVKGIARGEDVEK